jgi:hypothetical protein
MIERPSCADRIAETVHIGGCVRQINKFSQAREAYRPGAAMASGGGGLSDHFNLR